MASSGTKPSEVPLCAFIVLLLTHCYSVFAILDRRVYVDEDIRKNYKVEDFLWSGSGDGENETDGATTEEQTWERTTTVFHTTTVVSTSTVFYSAVSTVISESPHSVECPSKNISCSIAPTPTIRLPSSTIISPWPPPTDYPTFADAIPDQRYWLITVLKVNSTNIGFVPFELGEHLAKLYKIAFHRHQERHLGLQSTGSDTWNKSTIRSRYISRKRRDHRDTVTVHIHNVSNDDALSILYSVKVSGVPVLATTAAHDMKLVSDAEVVAELGYPVLTKAEPYLKSPAHEDEISPEKEYLFVLVSSVCAAVLVILFIFLFLLTVKKRKKKRIMENVKKLGGSRILSSQNTRGSERGGVDNVAFTSENGENRRGEPRERSPVHHRKVKTDPARTEMNTHDSQSQSRHHSGKPSSPNSFLSMPSVKDFPTTPLPEPLTNLLNNCSPQSSHDKAEDPRTKLTRHGSIEGEDPGVVGPMVWHVHRHRLEKADKTVASEDEIDGSPVDSDVDVGQMRKRFNRLLDDALSSYGGRRFSNDYVDINAVTDQKADDDDVSLFRTDAQKRNHQRRTQSAATASRSTLEIFAESAPITSRVRRPRTSIAAGQACGPRAMPEVRNAWGSATATPSTPARLHSRPLSAGPFHRPVVHPEFIFTDAQLSPTDPAVPIISAIKRELDKIPEYKYETTDKAARTRPSSSSSTSIHLDSARR